MNQTRLISIAVIANRLRRELFFVVGLFFFVVFTSVGRIVGEGGKEALDLGP